MALIKSVIRMIGMKGVTEKRKWNYTECVWPELGKKLLCQNVASNHVKEK